MKTSVEIKASSNIPGRITGVTINYGINMIPYCVVTVDASALDAVCHYQKPDFLRQDAWVSIETTEGCLNFDGIIDGISFSQSPGAINPNIVLKSKFQLLNEAYPRLLGFHPSSNAIFRRSTTTEYSLDDANEAYRSLITDATSGLEAETKGLTLIEYLIKVLKLVIDAQVDLPLLEPVPEFGADEVLLKVLPPIVEIQHDNIIKLFDNIDVSILKDFAISAGSLASGGFIQDALAGSETSVLEFLQQALAELGCCYVIGNHKMFIFPDTGYIKTEHTEPSIKEKSVMPNIIYPAQYDNITFNDNGYKDIKGVILVHTSLNPTVNNEDDSADLMDINLGSYLDPNPKVKGGLMTIQIPTFLGRSLSDLSSFSSGELNKNIQTRQKTTVSHKGTIREEQTSLGSSIHSFNTQAKVLRDLYNQVAEVKYTQAKFQDRVGSISGVFNPNWVPGMPGVLYTRHPGTFIDFFVTGVSHRIEKSLPNIGTARTSISFNCGRIDRVSTGLDKITLFNYGADEVEEAKRLFVQDTSIL